MQYPCKLKLGWRQTGKLGPASEAHTFCQLLGFFSTIQSLQITADADLAVVKKEVVITLCLCMSS